MPLLLLLLLGDQVGLVLCQASAHAAGLLGAEVERLVLLALVEDTELGALVGVDDGEDTGNILANVVAAFTGQCPYPFKRAFSTFNATEWAYRTSC